MIDRAANYWEAEMKKLLGILLVSSCIATGISDATASVIWNFDLGPDNPAGPNSIVDGSMKIDVDQAPTSILDRANDRGWYVTSRTVTQAQVILDGVEWEVAGGFVSQAQCWDTDVFPNPGCGHDLDTFTLWLDFVSGGYLELAFASSPDPDLAYLLSAYPLWLNQPMTELTSPLNPGEELFAQGLRNPSAVNREAFQFSVESWTVGVSAIPEPAALPLMLTGLAAMGVAMRKRKAF